MSDASAVPSGEASLRILLLEDLRIDAEFLIQSVAQARPTWEVVWVKTEDAYLRALSEARSFGVILSDFTLPGFSGTEALEAAQRLRPGVPFILVSGVVGEDNAVEMLRCGATDFVSKGRLSRLPMVIDRALREVQERQQRELAQRQWREADALYARLVDSLKDHAVMLLDAQGRIRSWNPAAGALFGYRADEVSMRSFEWLLPPADQGHGLLEREMAEALAQGRASDDRWLARKDGSLLWAEGVLTPMTAEDGSHSGFTKVLRDATSAHEAADALRAAKEEAERANRAKDRFLAVLSHELRTPLTPISTAVHLLEKQALVPKALEGLLPMIRRNVALEARLIDDLLDLTSIGQGKLHLQFAEVDAHQVIKTVVEMLGDDLEHKQLRLSLSLQAGASRVRGDEARLQQVIWNVVRNAVKFTPEGGEVRLSTRVTPGGAWELSCTDTGIGIQPEVLPRIFTAFEQADEGVTRKFGGLGLGLSIAHSLAQQHQGSLEARSEGSGRGATFVLTLPLLLSGAEVAARVDDRLPGPSAPGALRVLLVEDNEDAALSMQMALDFFGHETVIAGSCAQALRCADEQRFDVVVTDLGLPDGSGLQIGRALGGRLPVVALSGYGSENDIHLSKEAGFASHLTKPIDPEMLHHLLVELGRGVSSIVSN